MSRRVIALVTDAFGGRGGIALYNRQFLKALCSSSDVDQVVALPRSIVYAVEGVPQNLRFDTRSAGSKLRYARSVISLAGSRADCKLVVCGHLHLLPFAAFLALRYGCPVLPMIYGIEAWQPTTHASVNRLCRHIRSFVTIRKLTGQRLRQWAQIPSAREYYLPNCVDLQSYGFGPKRSDLVDRYGLRGRRVILTAGRLDCDPHERNKGFDEVLETLPMLLQEMPDATYVILGDGPDQARLKAKASALGVAGQVVFTGYVEEREKADHYRLADVVAMPGSNPLFDRYPFRFAFLEPLACGIPVVGARLEDDAERDDPDANALIVQVDPSDSADIKRGILAALRERRHGVSPRMRKFGFEAFESNVHRIVADVFARA
jgi:phosphatidylinositol alpha-1,6-mannosyltransferase